MCCWWSKSYGNTATTNFLQCVSDQALAWVNNSTGNLTVIKKKKKQAEKFCLTFSVWVPILLTLSSSEEVKISACPWWNISNSVPSSRESSGGILEVISKELFLASLATTPLERQFWSPASCGPFHRNRIATEQFSRGCLLPPIIFSKE